LLGRKKRADASITPSFERKYSGMYWQDLKHGHGIFEWSDGKKIEGEWRLGKLYG